MQGSLRLAVASLLCAALLPATSAFAQADSNRTTFLLSRAFDGGLPNGVSRNATVSHDQRIARCVAFVSDASNLVPGDTNGKPDAFVYYLNSKRIVRVSTDAHGRQSNGSTYEVSVDGDCERVAFVSDATNLALRSTKYLNWKTSVTSAAPAGTKQVYVKVLRASGRDKGFKGLTFLASASRGGHAANSNSWHVSFARAGKAPVFASDASNLSPADTGGATDVYERTFNRHYVHIKHKGVQA